MLASPPFLIGELNVLLFEQVVGVRALTEFLVYETILTCQSLNVFCQFSDFLSLELCKLSLLLKLFSQILAFTPKMLDLLFTFKELTLVVIFLSSSDTHLMLDVREFKALLLHLLLRLHKLFRFLI